MIKRQVHRELLQLLLSAAWGAVIKAAQMFLITMIARQTAQIMIIIITALWTVLKQVTTIAVKQLAVIMENTTMTAIIKADNRKHRIRMQEELRSGSLSNGMAMAYQGTVNHIR